MAGYNMMGEQNGQTFSFYIIFVKDLDDILRMKFLLNIENR
jgi:hypothetical protein